MAINNIERGMNMNKSVAKLLKFRAWMFNCSYKTAWDNYLEKGEKRGLTYEQVMEGE